MNNKIRLGFTILFLLLFLGQIVYISFTLPQIVLNDREFPETLKLSFILAGICIGFLYVLKDRSQTDQQPPESEEESATKSEE